jgi:hypothetical protein
MLIEWTEKDPETGAKRSVRAEKFARKWTFQVRSGRYANWEAVPQVTRDMWETLLDALERRLPRREGVTDEDVKQVRAALAAWKPPPIVEEDRSRTEDRKAGPAS